MIKVSFLEAQIVNEKQIQSTSNNIVIDLTTFNKLKLKCGTTTNAISIRTENTNDFTAIPQIEDKNNTIYIKTTLDYTLKGSQQNKYRAGEPEYADYVIEIPTGKKISLFYTKGNLDVKNFSGSLEVGLNHGDIDIHPFLGSIEVQSHSGTINCTLNDTDISVENNHGKIIVNNSEKDVKSASKTFKTAIGKDYNSLRIKTVNAKVTLVGIKNK